ncbi:hypothetical protein L345_10377, partial [Ophiophagus hannah]
MKKLPESVTISSKGERALCGHKRNLQLFSSSSYLMVHFRTDGSVGAKGFKISFGEMNQGSVQRSENGVELDSPCNNSKQEEDTAVLGITNLLPGTEGGTQISVKAVYFHTNFSDLPPSNDISLLELEIPIQTGTRVGFPEGCSKHKYHSSRMMPVPDTGVKTLKTLKYVEVLRGQLHVLYQDLGGPLICKIDERYKLVGLVSWGSSVHCEPESPTVYTQISVYRHWISAVINGKFADSSCREVDCNSCFFTAFPLPINSRIFCISCCTLLSRSRDKKFSHFALVGGFVGKEFSNPAAVDDFVGKEFSNPAVVDDFIGDNLSCFAVLGPKPGGRTTSCTTEVGCKGYCPRTAEIGTTGHSATLIGDNT